LNEKSNAGAQKLKGRVKKKLHEKLSSANVSKVSGLLEPLDSTVKPITKKEACSILNITYNTTRLGRIISEHKEKIAFVEKQKKANRGKAASEMEISAAIMDSLTGIPVSDTATRLFRSPGFVKAITERIGVPHRPSNSEERAKFGWIPESCISYEFRVGEIVWSAKYHRAAFVKGEVEGYEYKYSIKCYQIYVV
jgi:hypothetical protein